MGIEDPNIFPLAAEPALLIKRYINTHDEDEKAKEVVLVEYRFNYSIPSKLVKSDLDNKVKFSKIYTQFIYQIPVHKKKYFVFKTNKVPEFERRLRRMDPSCSPDYIACSIKDISEKFFR